MFYIMKNIRIYVILLRFYAFFRLFYAVLEPIWMKKYHKIQKSEEKQNDFSTVFFKPTRQQDNKTTGQQVYKSTRQQVYKAKSRRGYLSVENS